MCGFSGGVGDGEGTVRTKLALRCAVYISELFPVNSLEAERQCLVPLEAYTMK